MITTKNILNHVFEVFNMNRRIIRFAIGVIIIKHSYIEWQRQYYSWIYIFETESWSSDISNLFLTLGSFVKPPLIVVVIGGDPVYVLENELIWEVISVNCASCSVLERRSGMRVFENGAPQNNVNWLFDYGSASTKVEVINLYNKSSESSKKFFYKFCCTIVQDNYFNPIRLLKTIVL